MKYAIEFHSLLLSSNSCCVFADKQQMFQRLAAMEASIQNSNNAPVQPIMQQSAQSGNQFSVNNQQVQAFAGQQVQHAYNNSSQPVLGPQHFILVILNCKPQEKYIFINFYCNTQIELLTLLTSLKQSSRKYDLYSNI